MRPWLVFCLVLGLGKAREDYGQLLGRQQEPSPQAGYEFDQYGVVNRPVDQQKRNATDEAILRTLRENKEEDKESDKLRSIYNIMKQNKYNTAQEQAYKKNPDGPDYAQEVTTGTLYVKDIPKGLLGRPKQLDKYTVRLNDHSVYFSTEEGGYRDIRGGMDLLSLVSNDDQMQYGQCCQNVGQLESGTYNTKDTRNKALFCFSLNNEKQSLLLCEEKESDGQQWRTSILTHILKAYQLKYNLRQLTLQQEDLDPCTHMLHNWQYQLFWECPLCREGKAQSPILIVPDQTMLIPSQKSVLQYKMTYVNSIMANPRMREKQLYQSFGKFRHINRLSGKPQVDTWDISKIQVKIPAEHRVQGEKDIVGEVLMTGTSEEGDLGVLSIFLKVGDEENKAVDAMMFDLWDIRIDQCLNTRFSVYELLKQIKSHCYYWYKGSLTSPPCTESVDRIVLKYPVFISEGQLKAISKKLTTRSDGYVNNREVQPLNGRRVYELRDCQSCEIPEEEPEWSYVKVEQTQVKYALANKDNYFPFKWHNYGKEKPVSVLGDDVTLEPVGKKEVPYDVRRVLDFKFDNLERFIRSKYQENN